MRLAVRLVRSGIAKTFEEMATQLCASDDPGILEWCLGNGEESDRRGLRRLWEKAKGSAVGNDATRPHELLAKLNEKHFVVNEAGRTVVYTLVIDPVLKRRIFERSSFPCFRNRYLNRTVEVGVDANGHPVYKNLGAWWLGHPSRARVPGGRRIRPILSAREPDTLNVWQGFTVEPRHGSWQKLHDHIRKVICGDDEQHFNYLVNLLALAVQKPGERWEVAVVLRGPRGAGKGILARAMLRLFGPHGIHISAAYHLIGTFNAHLRDCCFLFADEAFFAGDKKSIGTLNRLITEPTILVEAKYANPITVQNCLHIIMASNEDWVVPAATDERRYFVCDVSDKHQRELAYFKGIEEEMVSGGYEAMLHDLLQRDITDFDARDVPKTKALGEQVKQTFDMVHQWWATVLQRGYVFESKCGLSATFAKWMDKVTTALLFKSYEEFCQKYGERRPVSREMFGRFMTNRAKGTPAKSLLKSLRPCQSPDRDLDGCDSDEGSECLGQVLEVLGQAAVAAEP